MDPITNTRKNELRCSFRNGGCSNIAPIRRTSGKSIWKSRQSLFDKGKQLNKINSYLSSNLSGDSIKSDFERSENAGSSNQINDSSSDIVEIPLVDDLEIVELNPFNYKPDFKFVVYDEDKEVSRNDMEIKKIISNVYELNSYLKRDVWIYVPDGVIFLRSHRLQEHFKSEKPKSLNKKISSDIIKRNLRTFFNTYQPPCTRYLITRNLTGNPNKILPVYSDFPDADVNPNMLNIDSLNFEYLNNNVLSKSETEDMNLLKYFLNSPTNSHSTIRCDCCNPLNNFASCWENENCPCYKTNRDLQDLQSMNNLRIRKTEFKTFGKIWLRDFDNYYDSFAFCCSDNCACRGRCDNNVLYQLKFNINRFEIYRHDDKGFSIRAMSFIPFGTPVFEFCGEISDETAVAESDSDDYAFAMSQHANGCKLFKFIDNSDFSDSYKTELKNLLNRPWYINPKFKGNEARFIAHACHPNLTMTTVFSGGFTPIHTHCVLISMEDIFPGAEVTFDYGMLYIQEQLKNQCLCGTVGCMSNKNFDIISKATFEDIQWFHQKRQAVLYKRYRQQINGQQEGIT